MRVYVLCGCIDTHDWRWQKKPIYLSPLTYPDLPGRLWTSSEMQCETAWGAGSGPAQLGSCWGSSYHLSFDLWSFQWVNLGPVGRLISGRSKINVSRNETSKSIFRQGTTGTGTWGQANTEYIRIPNVAMVSKSFKWSINGWLNVLKSMPFVVPCPNFDSDSSP